MITFRLRDEVFLLVVDEVGSRTGSALTLNYYSVLLLWLCFSIY